MGRDRFTLSFKTVNQADFEQISSSNGAENEQQLSTRSAYGPFSKAGRLRIVAEEVLSVSMEVLCSKAFFPRLHSYQDMTVYELTLPNGAILRVAFENPGDAKQRLEDLDSLIELIIAN